MHKTSSADNYEGRPKLPSCIRLLGGQPGRRFAIWSKLSIRAPGTPFQKKLYEKAKREPDFRFYALYDKVCWAETLAQAYRQAKANAGAAGVDGVRFEDIESYGEDRWLAELRQELVEETYHPQPVRRVMIPKPGGGERPLGIPTIRDRVAQTAVVLLLGQQYT